jgi:hypothetical protein
VSKLLVADPNKRINIEQMLAHPWMSKKLESTNLSHAKSKLSKYISVRREKSERKNVD